VVLITFADGIVPVAYCAECHLGGCFVSAELWVLLQRVACVQGRALVVFESPLNRWPHDSTVLCGPEEYNVEGRLIFAGPRVAMALHTSHDFTCGFRKMHVARAEAITMLPTCSAGCVRHPVCTPKSLTWTGLCSA
jgi:hypothetical protein